MDGRIVTIRLPNGATAMAEVTDLEPLGATKTAAVSDFEFDDVAGTLEGFAEAIKASVAKVKPDKVSVELGLKLSAKSGTLTGLLVEGQGEAAIRVTLEWESAGASA